MVQLSDSYIIVGSFGRTHGVQGWIRINSDTEPQTAILHYQPWYIRSHDDLSLLDIDDTRIQGDHVLVHLKNINDPETAQKYVNQSIYIERSQLPSLPDDEYYWSDLVGLTVINPEGFEFGKVDHLFETGANDVLVIQGNKQYLIPFVRNKVILNVDREKNIITVDWDPEYSS